MQMEQQVRANTLHTPNTSIFLYIRWEKTHFNEESMKGHCWERSSENTRDRVVSIITCAVDILRVGDKVTLNLSRWLQVKCLIGSPFCSTINHQELPWVLIIRQSMFHPFRKTGMKPKRTSISLFWVMQQMVWSIYPICVIVSLFTSIILCGYNKGVLWNKCKGLTTSLSGN